MSTQAERDEVARAGALGRPVRQCPNCGVIGAQHYNPERIENDRIMPGAFTCAPRTTAGGKP